MSSLPSISKMSNDDLARLGMEELIRMFRKCDGERVQLMAGRSTMMTDFNHRMQVHLMEIRSLKEVNQRLQDDNQELRDLCCFLDDDRQKSRKLAREWQRFGKYTATVMKQEVSAYQEKLKNLDVKQQELLKENIDLKELCLMLDQEREGGGGLIDKADAQNNKTAQSPADEIEEGGKPVVNEETLRYIKQLEDRIYQIEHRTTTDLPRNARHFPAPSTSQSTPPNGPSHGGHPPRQVSYDSSHNSLTPPRSPVRFFHTPQPVHQSVVNSGSRDSLLDIAPPPIPDDVEPITPYKPEAVVNAMKVLEVHEHLERPLSASQQEEMDDDEKALVREMCNVVWRKLGESVPGYKSGL